MLDRAADLLEGGALAGFAAGAAYPWINVAHVLGFALLLGSAGMMDLRLLGLWPRLPADAVERAMTPLAAAGVVAMLASGMLLFAADARALADNALFGWKLALVALAIANALLFRRHRHRAGALLSLLLWIAIAVAGRMLAYV